MREREESREAPDGVRGLAARFGISPRKGLGQHFLVDRSVARRMAEACADSGNRTILEIGPGLGALTRELAERYARVIAVEIDRDLIPALRSALPEDRRDRVEIVCRDIMRTDLEGLLGPRFAEGGVSVCANLPYGITTPILMRLLESGLPFETITVMVQAEVADRLCAEAGSRAYGAVTVAVRYRGTAERLMTVRADRFVPRPKVDSAVVRIRLYRERPLRPLSEETFLRTVRAAFGQRRKTLANALSAGFPGIPKGTLADVVGRCGLRADIRGECLSVADFARLSDLLYGTEGCGIRP